MENRIVKIETELAHAMKTIDDLNQVVVSQAKIIDFLVKQHKSLEEAFLQSTIKSATEEVPPPHY